MKLGEFTKKHAGGKVTFKGELLISSSQIYQIHQLKEQHGTKFMNIRAAEAVGLNHRGLKVNDLTRAQAARVIHAAENYQPKVRGGIIVSESSYELPSGDVVVSGKRYVAMLDPGELPDPPHHTDNQLAYPHQIVEINLLGHEYAILYSSMCLEGIGRTVHKEHLTVKQARYVIKGARSIIKKREKWPMWKHTKEGHRET